MTCMPLYLFTQLMMISYKNFHAPAFIYLVPADYMPRSFDTHAFSHDAIDGAYAIFTPANTYFSPSRRARSVDSGSDQT